MRGSKQGFRSSPRERRDADLFFADLMGIPPTRWSRSSRLRPPRREDVEDHDGVEDYDGVEGESDETTPSTAPQVVQLPSGIGVRMSTAAAMAPPAGPTPPGARQEDLGEVILPPGAPNNDTRRRVTDTTAAPFRFVCSVDAVLVNPADATQTVLALGSGTLISNRHVLTAGHVIYDDYPGQPGRRMAARVFVAPGRNGRVLPFGEARSARLRVAPEWQASRDREHDYGLITLENDIGASTPAVLSGAQLGFWSHRTLGGGTHIRPLEVAFLRGGGGRPVNLDGYPADKCLANPAVGSLTAAAQAACTGHVPGNQRLIDLASMQWRAFGRVVDPSPAAHSRFITYDCDTYHAHSGSPVWLRWQRYRNIVAIHTGPYPISGTPTANRGVRITSSVLDRIRNWMREDGVTATF